MKIKTIQVVFTWEDSTVNEVSSYLPSQTWEALELFSDYWEEKYSEKEATENEQLRPSLYCRPAQQVN